MYIRVNNITFSSKIEADAMKSLAKHEMINTIPGIISIESIEISETQSVVILKFDSKESAEKIKAKIESDASKKAETMLNDAKIQINAENIRGSSLYFSLASIIY